MVEDEGFEDGLVGEEGSGVVSFVGLCVDEGVYECVLVLVDVFWDDGRGGDREEVGFVEEDDVLGGDGEGVVEWEGIEVDGVVIGILDGVSVG